LAAVGAVPVRRAFRREGMPEIKALADCLRVVVEEIVSELPEENQEGTRLAMALFVRSDLGQTGPVAREIIARVFSVPPEAI
jgi:hypothetical protein